MSDQEAIQALKNLFSEHEFGSQEIDWKHEAQTQAAAAGELKIAISSKLKEIKEQQAANREHFLLAETKIDQLILEWKIEQDQKWIEWLESLL